MKIAIASSDGQKVDCHFGKAEKFFVYDIEGGLALSEGPRQVIPYAGYPGHATDEKRLQPLLELLEDCAMLYVTRIGDAPRARLEAAGVRISLSGLYVHEVLKNHTGEES